LLTNRIYPAKDKKNPSQDRIYPVKDRTHLSTNGIYPTQDRLYPSQDKSYPLLYFRQILQNSPQTGQFFLETGRGGGYSAPVFHQPLQDKRDVAGRKSKCNQKSFSCN
jgi:hypothetical protein